MGEHLISVTRKAARDALCANRLLIEWASRPDCFRDHGVARRGHGPAQYSLGARQRKLRAELPDLHLGVNIQDAVVRLAAQARGLAASWTISKQGVKFVRTVLFDAERVLVEAAEAVELLANLAGDFEMGDIYTVFVGWDEPYHPRARLKFMGLSVDAGVFC